MTKAKSKTTKAKSDKQPISLAARYDGAATTRSNAKHWSYADYKSADLDSNFETRKTFRMRARYEVQNNSYAKGIAYTIASDTIGTGPHIQIEGDDYTTRQIENDWSKWSKAIGLSDKLRTARFSKLVDGEAFLLLTTNDKINDKIKLDVQLIDADRITSNTISFSENLIDGMEIDDKGNVTKYKMLENHPSEKITTKTTDIDAKYIIHLYDILRPGQHRGVSELSPCLDLFGQLRDYTRSVLTAAQTAACLTGVIQTDAPAGGEAESIEPMETIELASGQLLTMPAGWELNMTKAEQPTTSYGSFKQEILGEIARCLQCPFNIAYGNSNNASYASSRLDWQIYHKAIRLQQKMMADKALDKIFAMWFSEWQLQNNRRDVVANHVWIWDGINEHSDPYKQAHADAIELQNCTTSLSTIYALKGKNWETEIKQIAREREALRSLGLVIGQVVPDEKLLEEDNEDIEDKSNETENDRD